MNESKGAGEETAPLERAALGRGSLEVRVEVRREGTAEGVVGSFGKDVETNGVTAQGGGTPWEPWASWGD